MTDTVSVVVPCYNKERYVAEAIESALAQTHACEVIVVDDGSSDGSLDVIRSFDGRIRWTAGPNRGGSAARNTGVDMAAGDWIQFLDADDRLAPDKVEKQLRAMRDAPDESVAFCPWSYFHDDGAVDDRDPRPYWKSYDRGLDLLIDMWRLGGFFPPHAWLVRKSLIASVGGWDTTLTGDDDGEFFGRILCRAPAVRFTPETSVGYRSPPPGSVSRNRSLESARSFLRSWESVSAAIAEQRWDRVAKSACLNRLRVTAYGWRDHPEILERADAHERRIGHVGLSPSLPPTARYAIGLLGIRNGLRVRSILSSLRPRQDGRTGG